MRLVQRIMLPESGQTHLAEFFLSGLIKQETPDYNTISPDDFRYEFFDGIDGIREYLLSTILVSETVKVITEVSNFIDRETGKRIDFRAIIADPTKTDHIVIGSESQPFAQIATKVLRRLGGNYADLATRLEKKFFVEKEIIDEPSLVSGKVEINVKEAEENKQPTLDLSGNNLTEVPESITKLQNLTTLNLSNNKLVTIPESIGRLVNLTTLLLWSNNLMEIPESITRLVNLTTLSLLDNRLTEIPDITKLEKLNKLYLSFNKLTKIPGSIDKLVNLTTLYLSDINLTEIPDSLTRLANLTLLNLDNNNLTEIPDCIYELKSLESLSFANIDDYRNKNPRNKNQIKVVSPKILQLENLKNLNLYKNPIENPPLEVVEKGVQAIKDYFRQIQEGEDHLYEAKLIIVGEPGAGKTSFVKKIQDKNYVLKPNQGSTEGIDVITWNFKTGDGRNFRTNIWDFGGMQIYHATHQFFLTKRSFYVLVCDMRKEDTDFYYWLSIVELLSDNSPLIIIKNEVHDRKWEISECQLRGQFTNLMGIFATNLATNRGLDEIVKAVKHYMTNLSIVGTPLPKNWVRIREILEKNKRNYINLDEYMRICEDNGLKTDKDKLQLSGYLHDIGVCMHFQEDIILRKTVILKPEWGTDAVYKVLDNEKVINNLGRFDHKDLASIWSDPKYANMHAELLQLMLNFKLCYRIPGKDDTYIAPQLLTENQPAYEWDENENLILQYVCEEFMPKGMLSRFIVEMHRCIADENLVWKSGVILERDKTKAEVIENYGRREIKIRVVGMHKKEFITLITDALDLIHDSFNRLKYKKLIPCNCSKCKNSQNPHFYEYNVLRQYMDDRRNQIECFKSYERVNVRKLIDDVFIANVKSDVIRILHLSDLHITEDTKVMEILGPLVEDLRYGEWRDSGKHERILDYIAVTGDFTNKAKKEEFEKARDFIEQLASEFSLSTECCILVPGNHDQSWHVKVYDWDEKSQEEIKKLPESHYKEQGDGYLIRDDSKYSKRFSSFSDYLYLPLFRSQHPFNLEDQSLIKFFDNTGILFFALNSSWKIDKYFPERANINESVLTYGLKEISKVTEEYKGSSILKIALWHHPATDDERIQNKDIMERIRNADFRLVLHGHVHEKKADLLYYTHAKQVHVIGTGSFGAPVNDRPEATPRLYNLLEISRDHSNVRVYVRRRNTESGAWAPDYDTGQGKSYYDIS